MRLLRGCFRNALAKTTKQDVIARLTKSIPEAVVAILHTVKDEIASGSETDRAKTNRRKGTLPVLRVRPLNIYLIFKL